MASPFRTGFRRFQASGRSICEQLVKKIAEIFGQALDRKKLFIKFKRSGQQTVKLKTTSLTSLWTYIIRS
jgi:hypothetical protein